MDPSTGDENAEINVETAMEEIRKRACEHASPPEERISALQRLSQTNEDQAEVDYTAISNALTGSNALFESIHDRHSLVRAGFGGDLSAWESIREDFISRTGQPVEPAPPGGFKGWLKRLFTCYVMK